MWAGRCMVAPDCGTSALQYNTVTELKFTYLCRVITFNIRKFKNNKHVWLVDMGIIRKRLKIYITGILYGIQFFFNHKYLVWNPVFFKVTAHWLTLLSAGNHLAEWAGHGPTDSGWWFGPHSRQLGWGSWSCSGWTVIDTTQYILLLCQGYLSCKKEV